MNFLETIFHRLVQAPDRTVLQEVRGARIVPATGRELLASIRVARSFLARAGLQKGDRCVLLAPNGIRWAAVNLAMMAEGTLAVPLYVRQALPELVAMMKDCSPSLVCCDDATLRDRIIQDWAEAPPLFLLDEIFAEGTDSAEGTDAAAIPDTPDALAERDPVTIIYTSGTSGEGKGVILSAGNVNHMLRCTSQRLDELMGPKEVPDRVFHYLPFCFAGSWILLLTCLSRNSLLTLSTNLGQLAEEMRMAAPDYFLNVPVLLERIRSGVEDRLRKRGGLAKRLFENAQSAWFRRQAGESALLDPLWWAVGKALIFPAIKRKMGPNLKALICGSAPLAKETQLFFLMMGLPVLQVYGLTETTAICTMDHPGRIEPGRVGPAIDGIEMQLGEDGEVLVRGPNIFQGYWGRPQETAEALRNGWFHTGDQGEVNSAGNWRVTGRLKSLIVLSSGHNVAPVPIEDMMLRSLPGAQQIMLVGNGRGFLSAIVTGDVTRPGVEESVEAVNRQLPHFQRIRAFHLHRDPFSVENGMLTANGKLKREVIAARFRQQIEDLYRDTRA